MLVKEGLAAAVERVKTVFKRRPDMAAHDDAPATARWQGGVRFESSHANGMRMLTDIATELGGTGDKVTPGWMFRAGLASCAGVTILMVAADADVELTTLEVKVTSRSDSRGLLGMPDDSGKQCYAGPGSIEMHVRIGADGVAPQRLKEIVERSMQRSPVTAAVENASPVALRVEVAAA